MKFKSIRQKVVNKVNLIFIGSFILLLSSVSYFNLITSNESIKKSSLTIRNSLIAKGKTLTTNNALALRRMVEDNAFISVSELVATTVKNDEDIIFGVYMDSTSRPWVNATQENSGGKVEHISALTDMISQWANSVKRFEYASFTINEQEILVFVSPIQIEGEIQGTLRYGFSLASIQSRLNEEIRVQNLAFIQTFSMITALSIIALFLGIKVTLSMTDNIIKPLKELIKAADKIAQNDYSSNINIESNDEVGLLANNFEKMRVQVNNKIQNMSTLNQTAEILGSLYTREQVINEVLTLFHTFYYFQQSFFVLLNLTENTPMSISVAATLTRETHNCLSEKELIKFISPFSEEKKISHQIFARDNSMQAEVDVILIPVIDRQTTIGLMCFLVDDNSHILEPSDYEFSESITRLLSIKLKNIYMREEIQKHNQTLELKVKERTQNIVTLAETGRNITAQLNEDGIFKSVFQSIEQLLSYSMIRIKLYDIESNSFDEQFETSKKNVKHLDSSYCIMQASPQEKHPLNSWCITHQKPIIINDLSDTTLLQHYIPQGDRLTPNHKHKHAGSTIIVPIIRSGQSTGTIEISAREKDHYKKIDLEVLQSITDYAAIALHNAKMHQQLQHAYEDIEKVSLTDPLTGLQNRRFLTNNIEPDIAIANRSAYQNIKNQNDNRQIHSNQDLIFLMMDLDHFKAVNDIHGHAAGDLVLIQIKDILNSVFRDSDIMVRWGGEEFLLIARFEDRQHAPVLAERLRQAVEDHPFDIGENKFIHKTTSIGYASYPFILTQPEQVSWSQVIEIADRCLYIAKKSRRNAWVGFESLGEDFNNLYISHIIDKPESLISAKTLKMSTSIEENMKVDFSNK